MVSGVNYPERSTTIILSGAVGRVGQVGAFGVEDAVVVAAAQFERDGAGDGARHPALGGFAQHDGLRIEPAALVEQATTWGMLCWALALGLG